MRIVLLGLPGAGKGTQGELLMAKYGIPHVSTGAIFREAMNSGNELGQKARVVIDKGELVPDDMAVEIIRDWLMNNASSGGFILDGFPRTVPQAQGLDEILPGIDMKLDAAINIRITEEEAIKRISGRLVCRQCGATFNRKLHPERQPGICDVCQGPLVQRPDDTVETARNRLRIYLEQTHPVVEYYADRGVLVSVVGEGPIENVFNSIIAGLSEMGVK